MKALLEKQLPLLGHRNWIVVVDSAYPLQTSEGIETIIVEEGQLDVVKTVLKTVNSAPHVPPTIYRNAEMDFVAEAEARLRESMQKQ